MKKILCLILVLIALCYRAQDKALQQNILKASFTDTLVKKTVARSLLKFKKKSAYFNPLTYIGAVLLYGYQAILSQQIQAECMYETSCSQYTKKSIEQFGFFKGVLLGLNQLSECFPGAYYEHQTEYTNHGKILNRFEE